MKNVLYLIFNISHGKGGHFYSLKTTIDSLKNDINPYTVVIGHKPSPIFPEDENNFFTEFNGFNYINVFNKLIKIIKENNIQIMHAFDTPSYLFARLTNFKYHIPSFLTKCGGPNLKYTPYAKNFILYSKENYDFLYGQKKFNTTKFEIIPNRVFPLKENLLRIEEFRSTYSNIDKSKFTIIRISRFVKAYEKSMMQSINLHKFLLKNNISSQLIILGEIQDQSVFDIITELAKYEKSIYLITDSKFTKNASDIIPIADAVVGTGRGVMEALSYKKFVFTTLEQYELPILINEINFNSLLSTNFSPRNHLEEFNFKNYLKELVTLIEPIKRIKYQNFAKKYFDNHFNILSVRKKYILLYETTSNKMNFKFMDLLMHIFYTSRAYITTRKKYK
jgi:hypothetical protein